MRHISPLIYVALFFFWSGLLDLSSKCKRIEIYARIYIMVLCFYHKMEHKTVHPYISGLVACLAGHSSSVKLRQEKLLCLVMQHQVGSEMGLICTSIFDNIILSQSRPFQVRPQEHSSLRCCGFM